MLYFGTIAAYLCINKNKNNMKKNLSNFSSMFSSEESFRALVGMIDDMELVVMDISLADNGVSTRPRQTNFQPDYLGNRIPSLGAAMRLSLA